MGVGETSSLSESIQPKLIQTFAIKAKEMPTMKA